MKVQAKLGAILDGILGVLFAVTCVILAVVTLVVNFAILVRYIGEQPLMYTAEIGELSLLFITFLGAAWVLKRGGHVRSDLTLHLLNPGGRAMFNIIIAVIGAITCLVLAWSSGYLSWQVAQSGEIFGVKALAPPKAPLIAIIALGSFLLFIQFLRSAYNYLGQWRRRMIVKAEDVREFF